MLLVLFSGDPYVSLRAKSAVLTLFTEDETIGVT